MGIYRQIYDFAAHAGALEGYVYHRNQVDPSYLPKWAEGLVKQYQSLPEEARADFQDLLDGTVGRAVRSLSPLLGEEHEVILRLKGLIQGKMPASPDDFSRPG